MNESIHPADYIISDRKQKSISSAFSRLYDILVKLRGPEGCPWDREQTPESFYKNLIEESYEYIDAFLTGNMNECREELGDMFLVVTMLTIMHEERQDLSLESVLNSVSDKLVRRHPHVFSGNLDDYGIDGGESVISLWDSIKENLEGKKNGEDPFALIPKSMPNMLQAVEIQKKARKKGFDWSNSADVYRKIDEELAELEQESSAPLSERNQQRIIDEFGDVLFSLINYARFLEVNPDEALYRANRKFMTRFIAMQQLMRKEGLDPDGDPLSLAEFDRFWEVVKLQE